ncbi:hypothetical protein GWA97_10920 [Flavobacterium sp. LaA7.5]|nr:hypothetical protein [Flavobacterium salilacus subsp. altitudinum]
MFKGRRLAIATMHHKDSVIAPVLETALGVHCFTPKNMDTDALGTFTGEVARTLTPIEAARQKCLIAMELTGCDLAVASEGSFGSHPHISFLPADDELLVLIDKKYELEIVERELSISTNFNGEVVTGLQELRDFAKRAKFPQHGLVLSSGRDSVAPIYKGITDYIRLEQTFLSLITAYGSAYVTTDMRAMYNPTRMRVIEAVANKLAARVLTACPKCNTPGFGVTGAAGGLPCGYCHQPTRSILHHVCQCTKCNYKAIKMHPFGKTTEDPQYCDYCNP